MDDERSLLEKIRKKDQNALSILMDRYGRRLFYVIYRFTLNHEDTEDIMQEVWIKFYHHADRFQGRSSLYTFLYRIAVNTSLNWVNKKNRLEKMKKYVPFFIDKRDPLNEVLRNEEMKMLKKGIDTLSKRQKAVFVLRQQENMSFKEIADILKIKENNAKVNYHHALKHLSQFLKKEEML
ncbi:MAG: sigma-70 family RNA polymerase sigma factor [Spirochaetes bacterium]|nr:sigma-70 family RNA polymerase sigma factor [Spirochaetota bacterium]